MSSSSSSSTTFASGASECGEQSSNTFVYFEIFYSPNDGGIKSNERKETSQSIVWTRIVDFQIVAQVVELIIVFYDCDSDLLRLITWNRNFSRGTSGLRRSSFVLGSFLCVGWKTLEIWKSPRRLFQPSGLRRKGLQLISTNLILRRTFNKKRNNFSSGSREKTAHKSLCVERWQNFLRSGTVVVLVIWDAVNLRSDLRIVISWTCERVENPGVTSFTQAEGNPGLRFLTQ